MITVITLATRVYIPLGHWVLVIHAHLLILLIYSMTTNHPFTLFICCWSTCFNSMLFTVLLLSTAVTPFIWVIVLFISSTSSGHMPDTALHLKLSRKTFRHFHRDCFDCIFYLFLDDDDDDGLSPCNVMCLWVSGWMGGNWYTVGWHSGNCISSHDTVFSVPRRLQPTRDTESGKKSVWFHYSATTPCFHWCLSVVVGAGMTKEIRPPTQPGNRMSTI